MPADYSSYPGSDDIELLLRSAALWPIDAKKQLLAREQAGIAAQSAAEEWETRTSWGPFLATHEPETRYLERITQDDELDLQGGMIEVQSIQRGAGSVLSLSQVRAIKTGIGGSRARPITRLALGLGNSDGYGYGYGYGGWSWGGNSALGLGCSVSGLWGCVETVPADVWQQIQQKAAVIALQQIEILLSMSSISQAGFSKSYDVRNIITPLSLVNIWGKDFGSMAQAWSRNTL